MNPYRLAPSAPVARRVRKHRRVISPRAHALLAPLVACVVMMALALSLSGCAFLQKHAKDALDVAQIACIIAHQFQPDPAVQQLCQIEDELYEPMRKILAESRAASDQVAAQTAESVRAGTCGHDRTP